MILSIQFKHLWIVQRDSLVTINTKERLLYIPYLVRALSGVSQIGGRKRTPRIFGNISSIMMRPGTNIT